MNGVMYLFGACAGYRGAVRSVPAEESLHLVMLPLQRYLERLARQRYNTGHCRMWAQDMGRCIYISLYMMLEGQQGNLSSFVQLYMMCGGWQPRHIEHSSRMGLK